MVVERDDANEPQIVFDRLNEKSDDWWGTEIMNKTSKLQNLFKPWVNWTLPEEDN